MCWQILIKYWILLYVSSFIFGFIFGYFFATGTYEPINYYAVLVFTSSLVTIGLVYRFVSRLQLRKFAHTAILSVTLWVASVVPMFLIMGSEYLSIMLFFESFLYWLCILIGYFLATSRAHDV